MGALMKSINECCGCGSTDLEWGSSLRNMGGAQDGRIRMHEVTSEFFLACNFCNETLQVISGERVAKFLTSLRYN